MLLEDMRVYQAAMKIGELVHEAILTCNIYERKTLGDQFIRAADSIALNIAEGYGRYHYKENRNFCWFARGSLYEAKTANQKAFNRSLISETQFNELLNKLKECHLLLNSYIKSIGKPNPNTAQ